MVLITKRLIIKQLIIKKIIINKIIIKMSIVPFGWPIIKITIDTAYLDDTSTCKHKPNKTVKHK